MDDHEMFVEYSTDDDRIHLGCKTCPKFYPVIKPTGTDKFSPTIDDVWMAANDHRSAMENDN